MDRSTAVSTVLAILLALVALALGLMHPSLLALAIVLGVVAVLVSPSPP
jgi:uncharacterized membrane protein